MTKKEELALLIDLAAATSQSTNRTVVSDSLELHIVRDSEGLFSYTLQSVEADFLAGAQAPSDMDEVQLKFAFGRVFSTTDVEAPSGQSVYTANRGDFQTTTGYGFTLTRAPGHYVLCVSEFILSKRVYDRTVLPAISDMREEYFEALSQGRIWKARWVRVRGTYSFFAAIGLDRAFAFVSFFVKAWKSVN